MAILKNTTIDDQGFITIPSGTTAQRPTSPQNGMVRYNTTLGLVEEYRAGSWNQISHITSEGSEFAKGKILQTLVDTTTTQVASTSTTWISSGLSATITPQFASSRIVVYVSQQMQFSTSTTGTGRGDARLRRTQGGSTSTLVQRYFDWRFRGSNSSERFSNTNDITYNETATVTTPITYFMEHRRGAGNGNVSAQWNSQNLSQMIVMEIAQ